MSLFPPSNACLRCCARISPYISVRHVSRTSAINRGLRASTPSSRGGGRQAPPARDVRIKKHTSHDDEVFGADAPKQRLRTREGRGERDGGRDRGREVRTSGVARAQRSDRSTGGREDIGRPTSGGRDRSTTFGKQMRRDLEESSARRPSFSDRSDDRRKPAGASTFGRQRRQDDYEAPPRRQDSPGERDHFRKPSRLPTSRSSEFKDARDRGAPRRNSYDDEEALEKSFRPRDRDQAEQRPDRYLGRDQDGGDERGDGARQGNRYPAGASKFGDRPEKREWTERKPQESRDPGSRYAARKTRSDDLPGKREWTERKPQDDRDSGSRYSVSETRSDDRPNKREWTERKPHDDRASRTPNRVKDNDDDIPVSIPYSTASSQFLYGTNSVLAALKAQRRKCHHLHVRDSRTIGRDDTTNDKIEALVRLARQSGIKVSHSATLRLLDKMSDNRPHNGVVLEASALPAPPLVSLGTPADAAVPLVLERQSAEDEATNGSSDTLPAPKHRSPLILFLDGITDPGNVGAILRTAHFFNVDAVAVATNTCANLASPVLAKASAGACEAVPIFAVKKPAEFVYKSRKDGWKVYAAVAPDAKARKAGRQKTSIEVSGASALFSVSGSRADGIGKPVILMLGAEGEGLRENLRSKADVEVTIERGGKGGVDVGVDSVNVSVAAGVLVDAFMRRPVSLSAASRAAVAAPEAVQVSANEAKEAARVEHEDEAAAENNEKGVREGARESTQEVMAVEKEEGTIVADGETAVQEQDEVKKEEYGDNNAKGLGF